MENMQYSTDLIPFDYLVNSGEISANGEANKTLTLSNESEFELHDILSSTDQDGDTDVLPNHFEVQITDDSTGRQFSNARIPQRVLTPLNRDNRFRRPIVFAPNSVIRFDFLNLTGSALTVKLVLSGYKKLRK